MSFNTEAALFLPGTQTCHILDPVPNHRLAPNCEVQIGKEWVAVSGPTRLERINVFHERLLSSGSKTRAPNHFICGWSSKESQNARFGALLRSVNFQGGTVIDYGCGTGDLYSYLLNNEFKFIYTGLDQNAGMLAIARDTYRGQFSQIELDQVDFPETDYVFASGVFQFSDPMNLLYYKLLTAKLFKCCKIGLAANFLSALRDKSQMNADELYLMPEHVSALASSLSGRWMLDHSYHPGRGDMTVGIMKEPSGISWKRPQF